MKSIIIAASLFTASIASADMIQSWRAVVIPNPVDPLVAADPAFAPPSTGTNLVVHPGESILFIFSINLTDTTIPAAANPLPGSILRGIGAATSKIIGSSNASGVWLPGTIPDNAGVYNSNGIQGVAGAASTTLQTPSSITGVNVISNGLGISSGNAVSGIDNTEGLDVLGIIWKPNSYSQANLSFTATPSGSAYDNVLWFRNGTSNSSGRGYPVNPVGLSSFTVTIIPAPASLALLGLGGLLAARRHR